MAERRQGAAAPCYCLANVIRRPTPVAILKPCRACSATPASASVPYSTNAMPGRCGTVRTCTQVGRRKGEVKTVDACWGAAARVQRMGWAQALGSMQSHVASRSDRIVSAKAFQATPEQAGAPSRPASPCSSHARTQQAR